MKQFISFDSIKKTQTQTDSVNGPLFWDLTPRNNTMGDSSDQNSGVKDKQLLRPPPGFELKINDNFQKNSRDKIQVDTNYTKDIADIAYKKITVFEFTVSSVACKFPICRSSVKLKCLTVLYV